MQKIFKYFVSAFLAVAILLFPTIALAAKPNDRGGNSKPSGSSEQVGYDISYPQCGRRLPTDFYFGIVGVNGGLATTANSCLSDQLNWAKSAKSGSNQPKIQLYVNTANPGEVINQVSTWPTSPFDSNGSLPNNPYGSNCSGQNDQACSWLYGWNRSIYTEGVFKNAATQSGINSNTASYTWWLDVETTNTWQSGSSQALARNSAAIEGFASYYQNKGAQVGLYSTASQWNEITGNNLRTSSNLKGLANWRPSGASLSNAIANCSVDPLTEGGFISLTQYVKKNIDYNHSCI